MSGTVFQRPEDNLWVVQVRVDGKRLTRYARSRAEAERIRLDTCRRGLDIV